MLQTNGAANAPTLADRLDDARIAEVIAKALAPQRCVVEFQAERSKIALRVYGMNGRELVVAAQRVDTLRDPDALSQYLRDVLAHLRQHKLTPSRHLR
jgi:hypothetical protein